MIEFDLAYPWWYVVLCFILGAMYAGILYFRENQLMEVGVGLKRIMAIFRFLTVSILAFLLLEPLLKTVFREVEKPVVIFAQDNSESLLVGPDSNYYREAYQQQVEELASQLSDQYEFNQFSFGDGVKEGLDFSFSDKQTDFSDLMDELYTRYSNRNIGAVIVATDGIINKGLNPLYHPRSLKAPVYTVAMGDTAISKDVILTKVDHNKLAYLGNEFPLRIYVDARQYQGENVRLTVTRGGELLHAEELQIDKNTYSKAIPLLLKADRTGIQRLRIEVSQLEGEMSRVNNSQEIFIDVLDSRQKILILANSPHPDIKALRDVIGTNDNYEVEARLAADFRGSLKEYNLVIFHQLPGPRPEGIQLIREAENNQVASLFIVGAKTDLRAFNGLQLGLSIRAKTKRMNEVQGFFNPAFRLFNLSEATIKAIKDYPPLFSRFGSYSKSPAAVPLIFQKIGLVETDYPLFLFQNSGDRKLGIITGEGLWRWRIADSQRGEAQLAFRELIMKTVQFLAVKADKSPFRVTSKNYFLENESIIFDAEVYNQSYELINEPEVKMEIRNKEGKTYSFNFSKTANAYRLDAGVLPVGEYTYLAQVTLDDKIHQETGEFSIDALQVESVNTIANHQLLYNLSNRSGGEMISPRSLANLAETLKARDDISEVFTDKKSLRDLIHLRWIFPLIILLLSVEWFLRKRNGAY